VDGGAALSAIGHEQPYGDVADSSHSSAMSCAPATSVETESRRWSGIEYVVGEQALRGPVRRQRAFRTVASVLAESFAWSLDASNHMLGHRLSQLALAHEYFSAAFTLE
jgi:hypothetical protein